MGQDSRGVSGGEFVQVMKIWMIRIFFLCIAVLTVAAGVGFADEPTLIFDPLPTPLVLPPGNVETLPLNHEGSFFGDTLHIVDCADYVPPAFAGDTAQQEVAYGTCGNQLFGGDLLASSHLTGNITIQFTPTSSTTAHFVVTQGVLPGDDGVISGPQGFRFNLRKSYISDAMTLSSGDLDLISGYATNIQWYVLASHTGFTAIRNVNPNLKASVIQYPGARGHAWARFNQRADGLLDFYFRGSTFLPLGNGTNGEPFRFPLPYCNGNLQCASVLARGSSLHPYLYLDTEDSLGFTPCAPNCPDTPENTVEEFTVNARYSSFGDDFDLFIPEQGGAAPGRAELQGRFRIQFGTALDGALPFTIEAQVPEGLFADPPSNPLLGSGFRGFLLGANQQLQFPLVAYNQHKIAFADEVYNRAQGAIDLASGQIIGEFEYPMYIDQSIIEALLPDNNGRVSTDPFFLIAMRPPQDPGDNNYAFFEKEPNGQTMLRLNLYHHRSFATYCFPQPSLLPGACWNSPAGGNLNIFVKIQMAHLPEPANPESVVLSDRQSFVSPEGNPFTYSFSMPCNYNGTQPFSFVYKNQAAAGPAGGTFTMTHPASISCTNSKVSTAAPGSYDQIAITGFGNWSRDAANSLPRFMAASISVDPANPYALIQVFARYPGEPETWPGALVLPGDDIDVNLSTAENKPSTKPVP